MRHAREEGGLRAAIFAFIQKITPPLHHLPSRSQILGMIVGGHFLLLFLVCQLFFDHLVIVTHLVQKRGRRSPESMRHNHLSAVTK